MSPLCGQSGHDRRKVENTDALGDPIQHRHDLGHMFSAGLVIVAEDDNISAAQRLVILGSPLTDAHRIGSRREPKLGEVVGILLALDDEDRLPLLHRLDQLRQS